MGISRLHFGGIQFYPPYLHLQRVARGFRIVSVYVQRNEGQVSGFAHTC